MALPKVVKKHEPEIGPENDLLDFLKPPAKRLTPSEIVDMGFIGGWKDRDDIGDSVEFVRKIRNIKHMKSLLSDLLITPYTAR